MAVNIDALPINADWPKATWDMPTDLNAFMSLAGHQPDPDAWVKEKMALASMPAALRAQLRKYYPDTKVICRGRLADAGPKWIETKGLRRVSSPEGVRRFHAPEGTPIIAHATVSAGGKPAILKREPVPLDYDKSQKLRLALGKDTKKDGAQFHLGTVDGPHVATAHEVGPVANPRIAVTMVGDKLDSSKGQRTVSDWSAARVYMDNAKHSVNWSPTAGKIKYSRQPIGHTFATVTGPKGEVHDFAVEHRLDGSVIVKALGPPQGTNNNTPEQDALTRSGLYVGKGTGQAEVTSIINAHVKWATGINKRNAPKSLKGDNAAGRWAGIKGWDYGTDEYSIDGMSDEAREQKAIDHAGDLGMVYGGDLSLETMETFNGLLETYNDMYPGFNFLIPTALGQRTPADPGENPDNTYASNATLRNLDPDSIGRAVIKQHFKGSDVLGPHTEGADHGGSVIRMTPVYFGANSKASLLESMTQHDLSMQWHPRTWADYQQAFPDTMEGWQIASLLTLNHELGHTVGHIGLGTLDWPGLDPAERDGNRIDRKRQFWADITRIMDDYDLIDKSAPKPGSPGYDPATLAHSKTFINQTNAASVLSKYGGKNVHELMGEAWCEYQCVENPRGLAREVGALMETVLADYLEAMREEGFA